MTSIAKTLAANRRVLSLMGASGLLSVLMLPAGNLEMLAWIAFVPLFAALRDQPVKTAFWIGWGTGLVHFGGTLYWITVAMVIYGHMPWIVSAGLLVLMVMYLALYFGAFAVALRILERRTRLPLVITAPVAWTALEYGRTYVFIGFPWNLLGYSQYLTAPMMQIADLTGVYGVSFLIMLVNAGLYTVVCAAQPRKTRIMTALVVAGCVGVCALYGLRKVAAFDAAAETAETVRIAVIQGNIDQGAKWDAALKDHILATYLRLSEQSLEERPDLIVWPETAAPFVFNYDPLYRQRLVEAVKTWQTPLLFGVTDIVLAPPPKNYDSLNSAFLLSEHGELVATYDKIHLVPFGEYVPFKKVLFFVEKLVSAIGEVLPGDTYTVMPFRDAPFSTVICFEAIFPDLVRKFVDSGAQFLVIITNDAWYGRTSAPYQHFAMATFRAVENRAAIARAANTGISGFIDPVGRITARSDLFVEDAITHDIPVRTVTTVYTRCGDVFALACLGLTALWLAKAWYNRRV